MEAPRPPSFFTRTLSRLVMVKAGEGPVLFFSTAYFFLLLFGYYLLRPMREAFGIARGADKLPWLMTGTMAVMFLANPAFAALVSRFPRRRFIPMAYRFSAANMAVFYLLFRFLPGHGGAALGYAFYIWLSVFNLFAVSVFWAFLADGLNEDQGKRLFGFIAMGGTLGAIAGAAVTESLTRGALRVEPGTLLLVAILCLELAVRCAGTLAGRWGMGAGASKEREPGPGLFEGLRLFSRSPYLALIGLYILLYTITSTFLYMQQGQIIARTFTTQAARTAAFARIDVWVNVLTLFTQIFLSSRLITRLGLRVVLCIMPVLTLAGFGALWAMPSFGVLALFQVLRRGLHYAVDRPAREVLYIPLGPEEKYKAKPFIDTFIYRAGDFLGTWTPTLMAAAALPLGAAALGVSGLWLGGGVALGRLTLKVRRR
jgi:ATP:ADP antiporter, AAA family